jgi:hypothetical protein
MKTIRNSTRWLGLVLACGIITLAATAPAGKPVKPPKPPPAPTLTYTLIPFDDGQRLSSVAVGLTETGLVPGAFDYETIWNGETTQLSWPDIATATDADADGLLDLPTPLPVLEEHLYGAAYRANELGVIVGYTGRLFDGSEWPPLSLTEEGVVWVPGAGGYAAQGVGVIDTRLHQSFAGRINNDGVVAGSCTWGNTGNWQQAFIIVPEQTANGPTWFRDADADGVNDLMLPIWPRPDPMLDPLSSTPMDPVAYVVGINNAGAVAGFVELDYHDAYPGAFVIVPDFGDADGDGNPWFSANADGNNTLVQGLAPLSAGAFTRVCDINANGEVAGSSDDHAVIWKPQTGGGYAIQDLGTISTREHLRTTAMSDTGWVVGSAYTLNWHQKNPKPDLTLVWQNGVMYVLQDILTNGDGWTDLSFSDVSDDGVLAGHGTFNGKVTACLAVPNAP